jgi:hypothetical protein
MHSAQNTAQQALEHGDEQRGIMVRASHGSLYGAIQQAYERTCQAQEKIGQVVIDSWDTRQANGDVTRTYVDLYDMSMQLYPQIVLTMEKGSPGEAVASIVDKTHGVDEGLAQQARQASQQRQEMEDRLVPRIREAIAINNRLHEAQE